MNIFERLTAQPLRRTDDGYLGGICAGLSHRWEISPLLLRLAFIIMSFFGGIGVLAYGIAWLLLPHDPDNRIELNEVVEGRLSGGFAASLAMLAIGVWLFFEQLAHARWFFFSRFTGSFITVIAVVVVAVIVLRNKQDTTPQPAPSTSPSAEENTTMLTPTSPTQAENMPPLKPVASQSYSRTPVVSGTYILITLALSAAGAAITMLATQRTLASALLVLGVPLTILGIGIVWAGIRRKRSSWLSFIAMLLVFPAFTLVSLSFVVPTNIMNTPHLDFFGSGARTGSTSIFDQQERRTTQLADGSEISAVFADPNFFLDRDDPVILEIALTGQISMNDLGGWEIRNHNAETFTTNTPHIYSLKTDEDFDGSHGEGPININDWYVIPNNVMLNPSRSPKVHVTVISPAAQKDPQLARHIKVNYGFGDVSLSEKIQGNDAVAFIARQRGIPIDSDTPDLAANSTQSTK